MCKLALTNKNIYDENVNKKTFEYFHKVFNFPKESM